MKTCTKCHKTKPIEEFGRKGANSKDSLYPSQNESRYRRSHCKECESRYYRAYYARKRGGEEKVRRNNTRYDPKVDARPVADLIKAEYLSKMPLRDLCERLAGNSGLCVNSWEQRVLRLRRARNISVYLLDELCTALGLHLSAFDPYYTKSA